MKKYFALLLSAAMVLSLAGCGGGKDARTIYDEASKKTSELQEMETMGQKIKYAMDLNQLMEQVKQSTEGANMESSYMKEIKAKKDGDNQVLTFTADAEKMDSYVQDIMGSMSGAIAGAEDIAYKIKSASGEAVVNKDGYFSSMNIKMSMDMTVQGETVGVEMDTNAVYHNPGQAVTLTAPDLEGYQEIDPAALGTQQ